MYYIIQLDTVQIGPPWGLTRASQRSFTQKATYTYNGNKSGVTIYIIDTGISLKHSEFEGGARFGARFDDINDEDENGHGTHVAGTVGPKTYEIAKEVDLVGVKALNEYGFSAKTSIIEGINLAVGDKKQTQCNVINMFLRATKPQALNDSVQVAYNPSFVVVVTAGNLSSDACEHSSGSVHNAITVATSDTIDQLYSFSNFKTCVDIIAPGSNINSTYLNSTTESMSGTSMAVPHVAGLAAYYVSLETLTNTQVVSKILVSATKNVIKDPKSSPNVLAFNSIAGSKFEFVNTNLIFKN